MEHKRRAHAAQRGSRVQQGVFDAASAQQPDDERQQRKDIADLIGAAGDKGQHRAQHSPAAVPCPLPRKQAEPGRHGPEQRPLRYGVVAVHAFVPDGGRGQRQRKAAQRQRIPAAQSGRHAADSEGRRAGPGDDVEPVVRQAGVKQQVDGVRVMEREKTDLLQRKVPQPPLQVLQSILPERHPLEVIQPEVQRQLIVALRWDVDRDAQIQHAHGKNSQIGRSQQQPTVPPTK